MSGTIRVAAIAMAALVLAAAPALAQQFPSRPIRIVVPYGAGSAPDVIARVAADELAPRLGQPVIVDNRVGAGGKIGAEIAARAPADGYTLLLGSKDTHGVMQHLYPSWDVDPVKDFAAISLLIRIQNAIVANPALKANDVKALIALARTENLNYGTPGVGTNLHLLAEMLQLAYGLKLTHVPYKNFGDILPAAVRGDLSLAVLGVPPVTPFVRDGRLKALGVTGTTRSPYLPDVPTFAERGVPGFEHGGWFALFAPAGTPAEAVQRLNAEAVEMGKRASYRERVAKMFAEPATSTPGELNELVVAETARWGEVVRKAGIKVE